jgi:hypothetical protein
MMDFMYIFKTVVGKQKSNFSRSLDNAQAPKKSAGVLSWPSGLPSSAMALKKSSHRSSRPIDNIPKLDYSPNNLVR